MLDGRETWYCRRTQMGCTCWCGLGRLYPSKLLTDPGTVPLLAGNCADDSSARCNSLVTAQSCRSVHSIGFGQERIGHSSFLDKTCVGGHLHSAEHVFVSVPRNVTDDCPWQGAETSADTVDQDARGGARCGIRYTHEALFSCFLLVVLAASVGLVTVRHRGITPSRVVRGAAGLEAVLTRFKIQGLDTPGSKRLLVGHHRKVRAGKGIKTRRHMFVCKSSCGSAGGDCVVGALRWKRTLKTATVQKTQWWKQRSLQGVGSDGFHSEVSLDLPEEELCEEVVIFLAKVKQCGYIAANPWSQKCPFFRFLRISCNSFRVSREF